MGDGDGEWQRTEYRWGLQAAPHASQDEDDVVFLVPSPGDDGVVLAVVPAENVEDMVHRVRQLLLARMVGTSQVHLAVIQHQSIYQEMF